MARQITARERFRAVFKHDTSELDRLPTLSLGTPPQGLFYQEWSEKIGNEDLPDDLIRLTYFGDKTVQKWISSEWHNYSIGWPSGYPSVELPKDHPEWKLQHYRNGEEIKLSIGWNGSINAQGKTMHGVSYGWYVNGYFSRQKRDGKTMEPWEVRDEFYAEHGEPWDDKFAPGDAQRKNFKEAYKWYEEHYKDFTDSGFWDFALMSSAGGLFEGTWEGMGSGTSSMSIMYRKYPGKLKTWLKQVKDLTLKNVKIQYELAEDVGAQIDFIWFWDDHGQKGRTIIDPQIHAKFWVPLYKEICDYVHKHGGYVIIHSCGFGEDMIPNWIEAGIDAWQTIERAALNEPARIREKFGNKIILIGAIDASNTVSFARSPDIIENHVKQTVKDAVFSPDDACYIPGFTHDLLDCPVNNVRVAVDSMLKYGRMDKLKSLKS
ncbi:MAG: uroporphyrinogen decarboxylase family protein [Promethearchaeota archaeon]